MPPDASISADLELAVDAARAAGREILPFFRQEAEVRYKSPDQPVTEADLAADRTLKSTLLGARPDYGWLSEETADSPDRLRLNRVWIVDPLDGTRSFVDGRAEFAVSIGLAEGGEPVLGVVYNPATDELFHATAGGGAFRNGETVRVSAATVAGGSILASRSEIRRGEFDPFRESWTVQPLGSTTYKMMRVAEGVADVFLSRGPKSEWDICAAALIVAEAGGTVTDAAGRPLRFNRPDPLINGVVVTNGAVHGLVLEQVGRLAPVPGRHAKEEER